MNCRDMIGSSLALASSASLLDVSNNGKNKTASISRMEYFGQEGVVSDNKDFPWWMPLVIFIQAIIQMLTSSPDDKEPKK